MPIITHRPITPGTRFLVRVKTEGLHAGRPERSLTEFKHRAMGRNCYGRITSRRRGGGHKKLYRAIDFRRDRLDSPATVLRIEYDPNRTSHLALIEYADKTLNYILAPDGLKVGDTVVSTNTAQEQLTPGLSLPLSLIPPATFIHCIEIEPGKGGQLARSAGGFAQLLGLEAGRAILRLRANSATSTPIAAPPWASSATSTTTTPASVRPAAAAGRASVLVSVVCP